MRFGEISALSLIVAAREWLLPSDSVLCLVPLNARLGGDVEFVDDNSSIQFQNPHNISTMILTQPRIHENKPAMNQQEPPEFILDVFADPRSVREVVKGQQHPSLHPRFMPLLTLHQPSISQSPCILSFYPDYTLTLPRLGILHTIFFHRFFPSLIPRTREVLDLTLPYVDDDELETMIEQRASELERQLDAQRTSGSAGNGGGRGQLVVQFFEKRRRKAWLSRGDEEVCWECWTVKVTVAEPRTESGA